MTTRTEFLQYLRTAEKLYGRALQDVCRQWGLSRTEVELMAFLGNNPGKDTARDIVELRRLPKANVSVALDGLLQKGLLQKEPDRADRRLVHLRLTPAAQPVLLAAQAAQKELVGRLFRGFTPEEQRLFGVLCEKMMQNLRQDTE